MDIPPEIINNNGKFTLVGMQMEVDAQGESTGKFRSRLAGVMRPRGSWPAHWAYCTHEFDGRVIDASGEDRNGEEALSRELSVLYVANGIEYASDDVSGAQLDPTAVHAARKTEMGFFKTMGVYDRVPRSQQALTKGNFIGTRWIDTNKGDFDNLRIRSRLFGKEFRTGRDDALYASTPPLEALRLVMSKAATVVEGEEKNEMMINDVSRAYFYAKCTRCMYVEIPTEDPEAHPDYLGRLRLCLHGTRGAALNWQQTLADHLVEHGFLRGVGHPSVFHHPQRKIWTLVHRDDYCSAGPTASLDWMQSILEKRYEITRSESARELTTKA